MAKEGLVPLMDEQGETYHRHIDDLEPEDVADRLRAERARCRLAGVAHRRTQRVGGGVAAQEAQPDGA